jgi:hypothetical protein
LLEGLAVGDRPMPDRHPAAFRKMFLREYLETQRILGDIDHDVTDRDVERLFVQTEKTTLVSISQFQTWTLFGHIMHHCQGDADFY